MGLARGGHVLISQETRILANPEVHDWGLWELKGLGRHRVFEVLSPGKPPHRPSGRPWRERIRFLTRFVGRQSEISQIMDAVLRNRLVTLRGMGGIGKTRLADEVSERVGQSFEDGVFVVELAHTQNSQASVVSEIVARLEVKVSGFPDEETALQETLRNRTALLILDNFETVMFAAPWLGRLLRECPGLHLLVTSQQPLGIVGEQQIEIAAMPTPPGHVCFKAQALSQFDSFNLLHERARFVKLGWKITDADAPVVAEILELTDGIPLAIELTAAWVNRRSLAEIRTGLRSSRADWLRWSGPDLKGHRHASLGACIEWSFNLLGPEEQVLLPRLSVFAGGFFPEDATDVCGVENARALLDSLDERSLLVRAESLGRTRYQMLPTLQEHFARKLGDEAEELRERHAQHFLKVLLSACEQIEGKELSLGAARISADLDNLRTGMETAVGTKDHRRVVEYASTLGGYLRNTARFSERLLRNQQALSSAQALNDEALIAECQNWVGQAYMGLPTGDVSANVRKAMECYEASLLSWTEGEDGWAANHADLGTAWFLLPTGDRRANFRKAIRCYEAALRVWTERDFPVKWALCQNGLGNVYAELPTWNPVVKRLKAIRCFQAALRVWTERDFPADWAMAQLNLGETYAWLSAGNLGGNLQKAISCYEAALRVWTEHTFPALWALAQNNLGNAYLRLPIGDRRANRQNAIRCYEAALRVRTEHDLPKEWAVTMKNLGVAHSWLPTGDLSANLQQAIACYTAALRVLTEQNFPEEWARAQSNLGYAYLRLPTGNRSENLAKAIACRDRAARGYRTAGLALATALELRGAVALRIWFWMQSVLTLLQKRR